MGSSAAAIAPPPGFVPEAPPPPPGFVPERSLAAAPPPPPGFVPEKPPVSRVEEQPEPWNGAEASMPTTGGEATKSLLPEVNVRPISKPIPPEADVETSGFGGYDPSEPVGSAIAQSAYNLASGIASPAGVAQVAALGAGGPVAAVGKGVMALQGASAVPGAASELGEGIGARDPYQATMGGLNLAGSAAMALPAATIGRGLKAAPVAREIAPMVPAAVEPPPAPDFVKGQEATQAAAEGSGLKGAQIEQAPEAVPPKEVFDKGLARKNTFVSSGGFHGQNQVMAAEPEVSQSFRAAAGAGQSGRAGVAIAAKQIRKRLGKGTWEMFKDTATQEQIEGMKTKAATAEPGQQGLFDTSFKDHLDPETYAKNIADPRYKAAGEIWDANVGKDLTAAHIANEGRLLKPEHLGPSQRYYPLSGAIEDEAGLYAARPGFEKPMNPLNRTRTGKGTFDVTDETLGRRIGGAQGANKTAAAIDAAERAGLIKPVVGDAPKTYEYKGETYKATRVGDHVMPDFVAKELGPILERKEFSGKNSLAQQITGVSTWGGPVSMEKIAHYTNQAGVLVSQAPTIGRSALARTVGNIPVAKTINAISQLVKKLPEGSEGTVREMMNNGEWFPRMKPNGELSPMSKVDLKGRLAFREALKRNNPEVTPNQLYEASTRFGEYNAKLAPDFVRLIKGGPLKAYDPFITASNAMTRNALGTLTMRNVGGPKAGAKAAVGGSIPAAIGTWAAVYYGVTHKFPDPSDENFKVGQVPYGETEDGKTKYINVARLVSPLGNRGLGTAGITALTNTLSRGGDVGQALNAAEADIVNRGAHLLTGPPVKFATRAALGVDPSIQYRGGGDVRLWPAHPPTRPGAESMKANIESAALGVNPAVENITKENKEGLSKAEIALKALGIISMENVQKNRIRLEREKTKWENREED